MADGRTTPRRCRPAVSRTCCSGEERLEVPLGLARLRGRQRQALLAGTTRTTTLGVHRPQAPRAITDRVQVRLTEDPVQLETRHLRHLQTTGRDAAGDQRLDLET